MSATDKLSSRKRNAITPVDLAIVHQIVDDPHALGVYAAPEWDDLNEDSQAWAKAIVEVALAGIGTPGAWWRAQGEPDPHGDRYAGERSKLALGGMTDDELANAVFMHGGDRLDLAAIQRGEPSSIALLTAAKDRIRWLSRQLEAAVAAPARHDAAGPIAGDPLTREEQRDQASRCSCHGSDDLCPCQNAPDEQTRSARAATLLTPGAA